MREETMNVRDIAAERKKKSKNRERINKLLTVPDSVMKCEHLTLQPRDHGRLCVGDYQRDVISDWSNSLQDAIRRGSVPPPIDVVTRDYEEDKARKNKLWVVDGVQRMYALLALDMPIKANVHHVQNIDEEKSLFILLNSHHRISAQLYMTNYTGASVQFLREVDATESHPMYNRILLAHYTGSHEKMQGPTIALAISIAFNVSSGSFSPQRTLPKVDALLRNGQKENVLQFLHDLGSVFKGKPSVDMILAFARVWTSSGKLTPKQVTRIRRMNLDSVIAANPKERQHLMERRIASRLTEKE